MLIPKNWIYGHNLKRKNIEKNLKQTRSFSSDTLYE